MLKNAYVIVGLLLLVACSEEALIGGDTDAHDCLVAAGYSWNGTVGACIREWELTDNQREAAAVAVDHLGMDGLVVADVDVARCPGCFLVKLQKGNATFEVQLARWEVVEGISESQCRSDGGIVKHEACGNETDLGRITGAAERFCCRPSEITMCPDERPSMCTMEYDPVCGFSVPDCEECIVTYSNGCVACSNTGVQFYIPGPCVG